MNKFSAGAVDLDATVRVSGEIKQWITFVNLLMIPNVQEQFSVFSYLKSLKGKEGLLNHLL